MLNIFLIFMCCAIETNLLFGKKYVTRYNAMHSSTNENK